MRSGSPTGGLSGVARPFQSSGMPSRSSGKGREDFPEVRVESGGPLGGLRGVEKAKPKFRKTLPEFREARTEVQKGL